MEMTGKEIHKNPSKLFDVNKQMLELKKKIQLSEGQRKALFEECEAERKSNAQEMTKLKKEIVELIVLLNNTKTSTAAINNLKIQRKSLETIIGPLINRSTNDVEQLLDLHIIDKSKQLNLLRYRITQRQNYLTKIGKDYQKILAAGEESTTTTDKHEIAGPINKASCDLQNSIHAVEVQMREANHIRNRYRDIRKSLQYDSVRFESNIGLIREDLRTQQADIDKLQQVMDEAIEMKSIARGHLLQEERAALTSASTRDHQTIEGKRLVTNRKRELEQLERRIFQGGKMAVRRQQHDEAEDAAAGLLLVPSTAPADDDDDDGNESSPTDTLTQSKNNDLYQIFDKLKQVTGGTSTDEVLNRFTSQIDTNARLLSLRNSAECEKEILQKRLDALDSELERYKYEEVKDAERKSSAMGHLQKLIEENREQSQKYNDGKITTDLTMKSVLHGLQNLHLCINPLATPEHDDDALLTLGKIKQELIKILNKTTTKEIDQIKSDNKMDVEEKWLPAPYNGLVRRTPLPQQPGLSPAPVPGSEDEEDVPSREYLKRQAQLVVDAKLRRKNIRMQLPKKI